MFIGVFGGPLCYEGGCYICLCEGGGAWWVYASKAAGTQGRTVMPLTRAG